MKRFPIVWLLLCLVATACSATPTLTTSQSAAAAVSQSSTSGTEATSIQNEQDPTQSATGATEPACSLDDTYLFTTRETFDNAEVLFVGSAETISRIRPTSVLDSTIEYSPSPQSVVCLEALPADGSQITCGWEFRNGTLTEVRLEPHVLAFTVYPIGTSGVSRTASPVLIFSECPDSAETPSLFADPATDISVMASQWDEDALWITLTQFAEWARALANSESLDAETCTSLQVLQDRLDGYFGDLLAFLEIDQPWQPLQDDWYPDQDLYDTFQFTAKGLNSIGLGAAFELMQGEGEMIAAGALSNTLWLFYPAPGSLEGSGGANFGAAYRARAGKQLANGSSGPYQLALVESLAATRCDVDNQAQAMTAAAEIANPETVGICRDLARAYAARLSFRTEAVRAPAERSNNLKDLLEPLLDLQSSISDNWTIGGNPFFDNNALYNLWSAELSLALLLDSSDPMNRDQVLAAEKSAQQMHTFARDNCSDITEGIDLVSVLDLAEVPSSATTSEAQARFCARGRSMLDARTALMARIDPTGKPTAWTFETEALFTTVVENAQYLRTQISDNGVLVNPNGEYVGVSSFIGIARRTTEIRLAHFGPIVVPMQHPHDRREYDLEDELYFLEVLCGANAEELAALDTASFVPTGPTFERASYDVLAEDLCPTIERALLTRSGLRSYLVAAAGGEPSALTNAQAFFGRLRELGKFHLSGAMYELFPENDELSRASSYFYGIEESLYAAATDNLSDWQIDNFSDDSKEVIPLTSLITARCTQIPSDLLSTPEQDAALFGALVNIHELPRVVDVDRLCVELDKLFEVRTEFRARLDANDVYDAGDQNDRLNDLYSGLSDVVELPAGFDAIWVDAMRRNEYQLLRRLDWGTPIEVEAVKERLPDVQRLEDYATTNCPLITAGLDLVPVLEVFGTVDPDAVVAAQQEFCRGVDDVFEARLAFRSLVPTAPELATDEARQTYDSLLLTIDRFQDFSGANEVLINPTGLDFGSSSAGSIKTEESLVWQTFFGPHHLPVHQSSYEPDAAGSDLASFAEQICSETSAALQANVVSVYSLGGPTFVGQGDHDDPASQLCSRLVNARRAEVAVRSLLEQAAAGDEAAGRDAQERWLRQFGFEEALAESVEARFPEAAESGDDLLVFVPAFENHRLVRVLRGDSNSSDRERLERRVALGTPQLHPDILAACPDLPEAITDLSNSHLLDLFDGLRAL